MAKLHEFDASGEWDTIVVDTPPTAHALDFLDAPRKLCEAIDSPAIEWFRKLQGEGGSRWSIVGKTGAFILKRLAKFVGSKFIDDLGVFFTEFNDILGGFRQRAEETFALLRQPRVGFVLVASPEPMAVREALAFHERLVDGRHAVRRLRRQQGPSVAPDRRRRVRAGRGRARRAARGHRARRVGHDAHDGRAGAARRARRARDARDRRSARDQRSCARRAARRRCSSRCRSCATTSTTSIGWSGSSGTCSPSACDRPCPSAPRGAR